MTGSYASFKGKLKVGDRVRVGEDQALETVLSVDDRGFETTFSDIGKHARQYWTWGYEDSKLELLTPSPRVVTLENLEPGDEVEEKGGFIRTVLCVIENKIVYLSDWYKRDDERSKVFTYEAKMSYGCAVTPAQMMLNGWKVCQPAQPSPSLVETEEADKSWWYDKRFWHEDPEGVNQPLVAYIVREAERRGAEKAWKEAKESVYELRVTGHDGFNVIPYQDVLAMLSRKIESLSKPVRTGEK